jgi:adenine phosphoribosyltransferase
MLSTARALPTSTDDVLKHLIRSIPDFPIPGINFKDITPLLADPQGFQSAIDKACSQISGLPVDVVVAIESRGFVLGAPIAARVSAGLILVRKPGKLPGEKDRFPYSCEYCDGVLEVHRGSIQPGMRCLVVDDLLATGGTARATADYIASVGAEVSGFSFLIELAALGGRSLLQSAPVYSVLVY